MKSQQFWQLHTNTRKPSIPPVLFLDVIVSETSIHFSDAQILFAFSTFIGLVSK